MPKNSIRELFCRVAYGLGMAVVFNSIEPQDPRCSRNEGLASFRPAPPVPLPLSMSARSTRFTGRMALRYLSYGLDAGSGDAPGRGHQFAIRADPAMDVHHARDVQMEAGDVVHQADRIRTRRR